MTAGVTLPADGDGDTHEELFYESLDRILSSSCSSTSTSDDESSTGDRLRRRCPSSFSVSSSLDVWTSAPASVAERRRVLLLRLGLAGDPSLSRLNSCPPAFSAGDALVDNRSASRPQLQHLRSTHLSASGKPPTGAGPRSSSKGAGGRRGDGDGDSRCLFKNLNDGREFVVEEFREDGTWGELRELRTGRQLTVEEFELCVGRSPIVHELMRRQKAEEESTSSGDSGGIGNGARGGAGAGGGTRSKKSGGWLRSIRTAAGAMVAGGHSRERRSSDEKEYSSEKGANYSQDRSSHLVHHGLERIKVRQYGKSNKELSGLYLGQRIQAHSGSIWSIKFSLDGRYLASAGEDCEIRVWEIMENENRAGLAKEMALEGNRICDSVSNDLSDAISCEVENIYDQKRQGKLSSSRRFVSPETMELPEHVSVLSERPICSFRGHLDDVLDLSWSKSQYLLSSSMDKTVRLWHMSCTSCLKIFSHSDYVTCIQFNPVDDRYFISGSLDEKVRIWSIPDRRIVDWTDLHEMITAASFTPDGKGALVGSHKGSCHLYDTSDNKLLHKGQIDLENKKKKSRHKKITGFQFAPDISLRVLVTSADSRIRAVDYDKVVQKFKGFRNTSSQMSASFSANGKYVICASEDSYVFMWRYDDDDDSRPVRRKTAVVKQCYEHFHCQDVTVAVPWPSTTLREEFTHYKKNGKDGESHFNYNSVVEINGRGLPSSPTHQVDCQSHSLPDFNLNHFTDKISATWPEELMTTSRQGPQYDTSFCNGGRDSPNSSAWGLAIVTANRSGEIRIFYNFGFPVRL